MMDAEQIECYRINYDAKFWMNLAEQRQQTLCAPVGAVLAVNALCDEVERLWMEIAAVKIECDALRKIAESKMDEMACIRLALLDKASELLAK